MSDTPTSFAKTRLTVCPQPCVFPKSTRGPHYCGIRRRRPWNARGVRLGEMLSPRTAGAKVKLERDFGRRSHRGRLGLKLNLKETSGDALTADV